MKKAIPVHFHRMKDMPSSHLLGTGTPMCAGCGGLETLHNMYDILGEKTVFVNAAGCMTLLSVYPFTPFRGGWLYTSMASAPAGAQGVRDAMDILIKKKKLSEDENMEVVVVTGDGSAYGLLHPGPWIVTLILFTYVMTTKVTVIPVNNILPLLHMPL